MRLSAAHLLIEKPTAFWTLAESITQPVFGAAVMEPSSGGLEGMLTRFMQMARLDLDVEMDELTFGKFRASRMVLRGAKDDRGVIVEPLIVSVNGSDMELELHLDRTGGVGVAKLRVISSSLPLGGEGPGGEGSGFLTLDAELGASGRSWGELAGGVSGSIDIGLRDGEIEPGLLGEGFDKTRSLVMPWLRETDSLWVNEFGARLDISNGNAVVSDVTLDSQDASFEITGTIDLDAQSLYLDLSPLAADPAIADLVVPLIVAGPMFEPAVFPNPVGDNIRPADN